MDGQPQIAVVAISGRVCAGKTTLAKGLAITPRLARLSTRAVLIEAADSADRRGLQRAGEVLDAATGGKWVADAVRKWASSAIDSAVAVDAVRIAGQIGALRNEWPVVHIHLTAPVDVLADRYYGRRLKDPDIELPSYADVASDPTEAEVETLSGLADLTVDTSEQARTAVVSLLIDQVQTDASAGRPELAALASALEAVDL